MGQYRKNNEDFIGLHVSDTLDNLDVQDCVLAVPSSPWQLPFALGQQKKLNFFRNPMLTTLVLIGSEHWAPFNFS